MAISGARLTQNKSLNGGPRPEKPNKKKRDTVDGAGSTQFGLPPKRTALRTQDQYDCVISTTTMNLASTNHSRSIPQPPKNNP